MILNYIKTLLRGVPTLPRYARVCANPFHHGYTNVTPAGLLPAVVLRVTTPTLTRGDTRYPWGFDVFPRQPQPRLSGRGYP